MTRTIAALIALGVAAVFVGALLDIEAVPLALFAALWFAAVWIFTKTLGRRRL